MNAIDAMIGDGTITAAAMKALTPGVTTWMNDKACKVAKGEPSGEILAFAEHLRTVARQNGAKLANGWGMLSERGVFTFEFAFTPQVDERIGSISWKIGSRPKDMQPAKIRLTSQIKHEFGCYTDVVVAAGDLSALLELSGCPGHSEMAALADHLGYRSGWRPPQGLSVSFSTIDLLPIAAMDVAA